MQMPSFLLLLLFFLKWFLAGALVSCFSPSCFGRFTCSWYKHTFGRPKLIVFCLLIPTWKLFIALTNRVATGFFSLHVRAKFAQLRYLNNLLRFLTWPRRILSPVCSASSGQQTIEATTTCAHLLGPHLCACGLACTFPSPALGAKFK